MELSLQQVPHGPTSTLRLFSVRARHEDLLDAVAKALRAFILATWYKVL